MIKFKNRSQAGQLLAERLIAYKEVSNTLILALPRGGVPVAYEIAKKLHLPLDIYLVRKLGVPGHEELAMGAIANGDVTIFNPEIINSWSLTATQIDPVIAAERQELIRRSKVYREDRPSPSIENKTTILVDDGLATGATMRAAIISLKKADPAKIIVAVPVGSPEICTQLKQEIDELICICMPEILYGVGAWYENFPQISDEEVLRLLRLAKIDQNN